MSTLDYGFLSDQIQVSGISPLEKLGWTSAVDYINCSHSQVFHPNVITVKEIRFFEMCIEEYNCYDCEE